MANESVKSLSSRAAWERLYAKHGLQYGGRGEVAMLLRAVRPGSLVLDAGCGDGKTTEELSKHYQVVACDFSREALVSFRSQRPSIATSLELVECDMTHLPFVSEKFDAVACVHSLSHMLAENRSKAATEMAGVLRRGGFVFVEVFGRGDIRFGEGDELEPGTYRRGNGIITHYFRLGEVPSLFAGFRCIAEVCDRRHVSFGVVSGKRELIRVLLRK
ncbi:MAG: class I SAM-dependent methyltransferase [Thermoplasmata archaeon]